MGPKTPLKLAGHFGIVDAAWLAACDLRLQHNSPDLFEIA